MNYRRNEDKLCDRYDTSVMYNNIISVEVTGDVAEEPLTLAEAKRHLRVDFADEDVYIAYLIKEAREQIEEETGVALAPKKLKARIRNELGYISLPYWTPNAEVVELSDVDGVVQNTDSYTIRNGVLETLYYTDVFVEYTTGYELIPFKYLRMIKERVAYLYAHRGDEKKTSNNGVWLA